VYLPNLISVLRLLLAPLIIWLIVSDRLLGAFVVFVVAGATDALDGWIARHFRWQTELGAYLDPAADKALLVSIFVTLGTRGYLPAWLVIAAVSRDVLILGAVMISWLMGQPVEVRPLFISKMNTLGQITLASVVLAEFGLGLGLHKIVTIMVWIVGILTMASAGAYLATWLRHMARYEYANRAAAADRSAKEAADGAGTAEDRAPNGRA
jgi:cardiolipin synthase (CMP-forming)